MAEEIFLPRSWQAGGRHFRVGPDGPPTLVTCSTAVKGPWTVTFRLDGFATDEAGAAHLIATSRDHGRIAITAPNPAAAQALLTGVMLAALDELLRGPSRAPLPESITSPGGATCKIGNREQEIDGEQTLELGYAAPESDGPIRVVVTIERSPTVTVRITPAGAGRPLGSISNPVQTDVGSIVELVARLLDALSSDVKQTGGNG